MYIHKHCHMLIEPSQRNNVSLMALRTYWYEKIRIKCYFIVLYS